MLGIAEVLVVVAVAAVVVFFALRHLRSGTTELTSAVADPAPPQETAPDIDPFVYDKVRDYLSVGNHDMARQILAHNQGISEHEAAELISTWKPAPSGPRAPEFANDPALAQSTREVAQAEGTIAAVKHVRLRTKWGLADAQAYVERTISKD